ncbi:MAG: uncharacterized protein A8A55_1484 [Amphiamblys sp. WSBS2006]|nr:MAG: uncharacterized protein A8A55_1484 [Amphiamblys sp. WSBS2006]
MFFLEETGGVLILSEALWEKEHDDIQKKIQFLFSQRQEVLSALVAQLQAPDSFLLTQSLPNEAVLLTEKTTVTLSNIEISENLFIVLLRKTKITVGESFSITEHVDNEDCIGESGMARNSPFCLRRSDRYKTVSSLALENIERMPPSSIGCVLREINLTDTDLINILPKLIISKDCRVEWLWVTASKKEHAGGILKQGQTIYVGRLKKMWLREYAVGILPQIEVHGDHEVESLDLEASEEKHVAGILAKDRPFYIGGVKKMLLWDYAVGVVTKMRIHKDCEVERLGLDANRKEHVAAVLGQDQPFCVGRVKNMSLKGYAVCVVIKMKTHGGSIMESFVLEICEEHVLRILEEGDSSIELGRIRRRGFKVPREIRRKLRYTLVDGEENEVLEGILCWFIDHF